MPIDLIGLLQDIDMNNALGIILILLMSSANSAEHAPKLIGHFSNQKISSGEDPHILSGYRVSIYKQKQTYFGNIGIGVGSSEPKIAVLRDITLEPATKKLQFKAHFSPGHEFGRGIMPDGREARVILYFSGKLRPTSLAGVVRLSSGYRIQLSPEQVSVVMKKAKDDFVPATYEEWKTLNGLSMN